MRSRTIRIATVLALALAPAGATARESLGVFGSWGAFRDAVPRRCYAIARPAGREGPAGRFLAVSSWPAARARAQVQARLGRTIDRGTAVVLSTGDIRIPLVVAGPDAWTPDARADAVIVAAMRGGERIVVSGRAGDGRRFADAYGLRGAATAIDAAVLACARLP